MSSRRCNGAPHRQAGFDSRFPLQLTGCALGKRAIFARSLSVRFDSEVVHQTKLKSSKRVKTSDCGSGDIGSSPIFGTILRGREAASCQAHNLGGRGFESRLRNQDTSQLPERFNGDTECKTPARLPVRLKGGAMGSNPILALFEMLIKQAPCVECC